MFKGLGRKVSAFIMLEQRHQTFGLVWISALWLSGDVVSAMRPFLHAYLQDIRRWPSPMLTKLVRVKTTVFVRGGYMAFVACLAKASPLRCRV